LCICSKAPDIGDDVMRSAGLIFGTRVSGEMGFGGLGLGKAEKAAGHQ
jgi:hypothetical protein